VVEFMDALGVARTAVYGFHTGAMIALALAARHPQRISCAVANGVVLPRRCESYF
jgi:2-hydroxy-6-oxonona-2,4-dienedioate hydrolase